MERMETSTIEFIVYVVLVGWNKMQTLDVWCVDSLSQVLSGYLMLNLDGWDLYVHFILCALRLRQHFKVMQARTDLHLKFMAFKPIQRVWNARTTTVGQEQEQMLCVFQSIFFNSHQFRKKIGCPFECARVRASCGNILFIYLFIYTYSIYLSVS